MLTQWFFIVGGKDSPGYGHCQPESARNQPAGIQDETTGAIFHQGAERTAPNATESPGVVPRYHFSQKPNNGQHLSY